MIGFVEMVRGIGGACGPSGVVGEQKQALAGFVESSHGSKPPQMFRQERINGVTAFFVGGGGDNAAGFVEQEIEFFGSGDAATFDLDAINAETHGSRGICGTSAV